MATEDRHLHKTFRDVAKARGKTAADIVAAAKKAGLSKWTVWQYWNGKHTPAFRRIVEMCSAVGMKFYVEYDDKLYRIGFTDERGGHRSHEIVVGDLVNAGSVLDQLNPEQRSTITALIEHYTQTTAAKKRATARPAKRKAARAA